MGFIIATLIVLTVVASILAQDFSIFSWDYWQDGSTTTSRSEVFRNGGLFLVALFGLGFAYWRARIATRQAEAAAARADATIKQASAANEQASAANEQARAANVQAIVAEQGHITERFSRAVDQLGHNRVAVRIGGLYALKRIAEDSVERDHSAVMAVLANFIRQSPYINEQRKAAKAAATTPPPELIDCPDIIATIEIIQGRNDDQRAVEGAKYRPSVTRANFSYLQLQQIDLFRFDLAGAFLKRANLAGAKLLDTIFVGADLTNTNLKEATLTNANFRGADFRGADLSRAILPAARLVFADLTEATLTSANLRGADLTGATLTGASLEYADLAGANLTGANLSGAKYVTQQQVDAVRYVYENPPELPLGLVLRKPPPGGSPKLPPPNPLHPPNNPFVTRP